MGPFDHWRRLGLTAIALVAAAFLVPRWAPAPELTENRVLATLPSPPRDLAGLRGYADGLDAYVKDRFPPRAHLIALLNAARLRLGISGSERVLVGRDGWLFYDDGTHLGPARGEQTLSQAETRAWLRGLRGRTEALQARGVPYVMMIAPLKETVYPQFAPAWFDGPAPDRAALRLTDLARRSGAGEVLHLHDPVAAVARAGGKAFSRHDTHWTGYGAYAGYVALMTRLQALGVVREPARPLSDFAPKSNTLENTPRDLALMLGVASFVDVDYADLRNAADEQRMRTSYLGPVEYWTTPHVIDTGQVGKPVALLTVDSFSNALMPFLYSHFSRLVVAHNEDGKWREDLIARYAPDVVILEVIEAGAPSVMAPAPEPSAEGAARIETALLPRLRPTAQDPDRRKALDAARPAKGCNLERAMEPPRGLEGPVIDLAGWVSELDGRPGLRDGLARFQGSGGDFVVEIAIDRPRPDVADHFGRPAAVLSGFDLRVAAGPAPPGAYRVTTYRRTHQGWTVCSQTGELVLR